MTLCAKSRFGITPISVGRTSRYECSRTIDNIILSMVPLKLIVSDRLNLARGLAWADWFD